jgi:DNA-binding NarL/FixJ family response regulator
VGTIKLIIVDDHPLIRTGIKLYLGTIDDIELVADFGDGQSAIDFILNEDIDIALVDLQMPNMSGIEVVKSIRKLGIKTKAVLFTHLEDKKKIQEGMAEGASGYLVKDAPADELINAIRIINQGRTYLGSSAAQALLSNDKSEDNVEELTKREDEVLQLIAKGLTNRQIAEKIIVSETTVKTHVSNILQKLRVDSRTQAALFVLRGDHKDE